jgi:CheY-like chemotaxis protein
MNDCILVVDDDAAIRDFLTMLLSDEGYEVCTARHGAEALAIVGQQSLQLILLDIAMPVMDGPAFLTAYCPQHPEAPVIAFSAQQQSLPPFACVVAFLKKPFDVEELLHLVEVHRN